jgi:hypothetical protein
MQKLFGIICMAVGAFGMAVYPAMEKIITREEKIAMLLGFVMIVFGFIIMYSDRGKSKNNNHHRKSRIGTDNTKRVNASCGQSRCTSSCYKKNRG